MRHLVALLLLAACSHPAPVKRPPGPSETGHVTVGDGVLLFDGQPAFEFKQGGCAAGRFVGLDEQGGVLYYGQVGTAGCEDNAEGGTDRFQKLDDFAVCQQLVIDVAGKSIGPADHWDGKGPDGAPAWCRTAIAAAKAPPAGDMGVLAPMPAGALLFVDRKCITCHTIDGQPGGGPTMKGLFGKVETFSDGNTLIVDEPYLREAITRPQATTVKGFAPDKMPKIELTEAEVAELVAYIKGLE